MTGPRILHLAHDDKFIDQAILVFEQAFPGKNDVLVLARSKKLKFVKLKPKRVVLVKLPHKRTPRIEACEYQEYDVVVFHSFGGLLYPEIFNIPANIPTVWLGWGFDYYDLITDTEKLLLPQTSSIASQLRKPTARSRTGKSIRFILDFLKISKSRKKAIEKVSLFSPVLPDEYDAVRNARNWKNFPASARWNYGTIEDHFIKGFEGEQINGNAVLVGNSASVTCNHLETLVFLHRIGINDRKIVVPLSYGDTNYAQNILERGRSFFDVNFEGLIEFMPAQDYVATIKKCGYVIMNHKRQQAVGNIVIMLYLGAKIFLREENPTYTFLKHMGVSFCSVQELERNSGLLDSPLTDKERENNRKLVSDYWSRKRGVERTKTVVNQAMALLH